MVRYRHAAGIILLMAAMVFAGVHVLAADVKDPARLLVDDASLASPETLPLARGKTSAVYRAQQGEWQFNLHSYIEVFEGKFWAMWSSGRVDEDSASQLLRYATSEDGHSWSAADVLVDDPDGPTKPGRWIARGLFQQDGELHALCAYVEERRETDQGRESWPNLELVRFTWTGEKWSRAGTLLDNCMNNYPPRRLGRRMFMTCRDSFSRMHTALSTDAEGRMWDVRKLPGEDPHDRMSEPSWYVDLDGVVHLVFRDARRSRRLYRSISHDQGKTWPAPVRTNYPDATSKNFTGRLSNGWYFLINNPKENGRDPLAISFSQDGWIFGKPLALRKDAPQQRFPGRAKGSDSFQYPHAIEHGGALWVIYSTNKEDIEISEFKISDFGLAQ